MPVSALGLSMGQVVEKVDVGQKPVLVTSLWVTLLQAVELVDVEQKPVLVTELRVTAIQAVKLVVAEVLRLPSGGSGGGTSSVDTDSFVDWAYRCADTAVVLAS